GHEVADDLLGDGRRTRLAVLVVVVVAGAGLLAATIHLAEYFTDRGALRGFLRPPDVQAREVGHGERPHRQAELVEHLVDVPGHAALAQHGLRLAGAGREDAAAAG